MPLNLRGSQIKYEHGHYSISFHPGVDCNIHDSPRASLCHTGSLACCSSLPLNWGRSVACSDQQGPAERMLCDSQGKALLFWDNSLSCKEPLGSVLEDERHMEGDAQLTSSTYHQTFEWGCQTQAAPADLTGLQTRGWAQTTPQRVGHLPRWAWRIAQPAELWARQWLLFVCPVADHCPSLALSFCDSHTDLFAILQCNVIFHTFLEMSL